MEHSEGTGPAETRANNAGGLRSAASFPADVERGEDGSGGTAAAKVAAEIEDTRIQAEIIRLHTEEGMGRKKIARTLDGATSRMVTAVLAVHKGRGTGAGDGGAGDGGGGKEEKKGRVESASRHCAGCGKAGADKQCMCKRVVYCNRRCQKDHWGRGGHKRHCTAVARNAAAARPRRRVSPDASPATHSECQICLDTGSAPVLQRGCYCRGDAGLAHVACLIELATHDQQSKGTDNAWTMCGTCHGTFTGQMEHGLADAWWSRVRMLPEHDDNRLAAANTMGISLRHRGKHALAAEFQREVLELEKRHYEEMLNKRRDQLRQVGAWAMCCPQAPTTSLSWPFPQFPQLLTRRFLVVRDGPSLPLPLLPSADPCLVQVELDKHPQLLDEWIELIKELDAVLQRAKGLHVDEQVHQRQWRAQWRIVKAQGNLGVTLSRQGKFSEAEPLQRRVYAQSTQCHGRESVEAVKCCVNLSTTLMRQGKYAEAETLCQDMLAVRGRVGGDEDRKVFFLWNNLCGALLSQDKVPEAERLSLKLLARQKQVLGDEHPDTLNSMHNRAMLLLRLGKLAEAESLERKVLTVQTRLLGDEHPERLKCAAGLVVMLCKNGKLAESEWLNWIMLAAHGEGWRTAARNLVMVPAGGCMPAAAPPWPWPMEMP